MSGGGVKGFAQIGVLKVFEAIGLPIDYIAGSSMGSIIGGLYAIGYSASDLEDLVATVDWKNLFSDNMGRRSFGINQKLWNERSLLTLPIRNKKIAMPSGVKSGQKVSRLLSRLTLHVHHIEDFSQFPIPFVCLATDIATGEAVILRSGFLAEALRASMTIPSVFTPIEIGNRRLIDGGEIRTIPVEDVQNMGADIIIAIDCTSRLYEQDELESLITIHDQTVRFHKVAANRAQLQKAELVIRPNFKSIGLTDFSQNKRIIGLGEKAARAMLPQLQALLDSLEILANDVKNDLDLPPGRLDSFYITDIVIRGERETSEKLVLKELDIQVPHTFTIDEIETTIDRIYSLQLFERVTYQVLPNTIGSTLIIKVVETDIDEFRFGLRYDSTNDAAVLLNTLMRNVALENALLNLDLRLGKQIRFDGQYLIPVGFIPSSGIRARLNYFKDFFDIFDDRTRQARIDVSSIFFEALLGNFFSSQIAATIGFRFEYNYASGNIGSQALIDSLTFDENGTLFINQIWIDTFDRATFPTSGIFLILKNELAYENVGNKTTFSRHFFDFKAIIPMHKKVSFINELLMATSSGGLPPGYGFTFGNLDRPVLFPDRILSSVSFLGFKTQELSGRHAQFFQLGVQYEMHPTYYFLIRANAGNVFEEWKFDFSPDRFESGIGLTIGRTTPLGPLEFTLMRGSRHKFLTHINIGYKF